MILKPITDIKQFAALAQPHIGVFGSEKWLQVYGKQLSLIGIYKDEKQLIGGFYFLKTSKKGISLMKLPPYSPHCGLFFNSDAKNRASVNSFAKDIVNDVCHFITAEKAALKILAFPPAINDLQPFIWNKFKVIPNYTYRIDLSQDMDTIRSHFDSKHRNAINKAIKEGVEARENALDKQQLLNFFSTSLKQAGANIYQAELEHIFHTFADHTNSFSYSAFKGGENIGNVFCVFDTKICYYMFGGVNKESGLQGINHLLIQNAIEKAKVLGCEIFDFEGSMLKGVEKFFRGFGPELIPYYTVNKAALPVELALKFIKREIF